jgi:hypothetical protein
MSLDDDLDDLYGVAPEEFTARRKELAAAAKKRGDANDAKAIAAARKPTAAAWVVNQLVRADPSAPTRLSDLSEGLRAAHAEMDGPRIRELTTAQRKLVHELVRSAFEAADVADPSAAMRDDVTNTLQAAIADPEVAERLGRLAKAEQFSGFGDFGGFAAGVPETAARKAPESSPAKAAPAKSSPAKAAPAASRTKPKPAPPKPNPAEVRAARRMRDKAAKEAKAAEAASAKAAADVDDVKATLASARRRYEKLLESLHAAEREVDAADEDLKAAQRSAGKAAERVEAADTALAEAEQALAKLEGD